jgi:hypothetical protein
MQAKENQRPIDPVVYLLAPVPILKGKGAKILAIGEKPILGRMDGLGVVKMQIRKIMHHIKVIEAASVLILPLAHRPDNPARPEKFKKTAQLAYRKNLEQHRLFLLGRLKAVGI